MKVALLLLALTLACDLSVEPEAPFTNVFEVMAQSPYTSLTLCLANSTAEARFILGDVSVLDNSLYYFTSVTIQ